MLTKRIIEMVEIWRDRILSYQMIVIPNVSIGLYDYIYLTEKLLITKIPPKAGQS